MARVPRHYPDKREFRAVWSETDADTRRRVAAAASRGRALDDPAEAGLAAGFARHHPARGPLMTGMLVLAVLFVAGSVIGLPAADNPVPRLAVALLLLGIAALNIARLLRLRRAEHLNAVVVDRHTTRDGEPSPTTPSSS